MPGTSECSSSVTRNTLILMPYMITPLFFFIRYKLDLKLLSYSICKLNLIKNPIAIHILIPLQVIYKSRFHVFRDHHQSFGVYKRQLSVQCVREDDFTSHSGLNSLSVQQNIFNYFDIQPFIHFLFRAKTHHIEAFQLKKNDILRTVILMFMADIIFISQ